MFRQNSGTEKFQAKEGEASRFCRIFFSHRTEKTSPGNHSVFQKISDREKYFMDKRGGITIFRRSFCLTVPKFFNVEHFGVSEKFFYQKFSCIKGGHHCFVNFFCLTGPKTFVGTPSMFQKIWDIEKFYA